MTLNQVSTSAESRSADMDFSYFLRAYALRAPRMMWFLGAGASAAAGIPTAEQLIWAFKRELYVSRERRSTSQIEDLSSPRVRDYLQSYFARGQNCPGCGAPDEYAYFFEQCYPNEADRRSFIDKHVGGARPSFGHMALAALFDAKTCELVWTTNFDRTIEDAIAKKQGTTTRLRVAGIDNAQIAKEVLSERTSSPLIRIDPGVLA